MDQEKNRSIIMAGFPLKRNIKIEMHEVWKTLPVVLSQVF